MISGFASTSLASGFFPTLTSITASFFESPICGAARPTPWATYMDSNMSSHSLASSSSNLTMGFAGDSNTAFPYFVIGKVISAGHLHFWNHGFTRMNTDVDFDPSMPLVEIFKQQVFDTEALAGRN